MHEYIPIHDFIARQEQSRDRTIVPIWREGYQWVVSAAEKHQVSYGESHVEELVHYLDEHAALEGMHPQVSLLIKQQASGLLRRHQEHQQREAQRTSIAEQERLRLRELGLAEITRLSQESGLYD